MILFCTFAGGGNHSREQIASSPHIFFLLPLLLLASISAQALTHTEKVDTVNMTVYAPDWIWQKNAVNVLVTLENTSDQPAEVTLSLPIHPEFDNHFNYEKQDAESQPIVIPPGETIRHAFTNIIAFGDVERQTYDLSINATVNGASTQIDYPLTTIRGAVVSGARWAMFLPAVICTIWSVVFVIALKRYAKPGAWKSPSQLDHSDIPDQPWMNETP